ncbi:Holliday junction branch migration DNA helicase RuvB [Candidatus Methylacidithermus pantelleriae]|uniref:Holliday junction branch migration complex subunit RuvB n=1 Tax=Candidatus Methylacidithermus pantelleriae TaxID=2744239 RepID=A0A8J2BM24_9BACT|nr:Holliday junction branch migration DNA helicase RuvB [Candidatus Methylacidithermus pantelleriae]CAF0689099.1 Holliday junction branch migration complex subunit RuvB [Candidatus Methylacidithermus pantelleriae]
MEQHPTTGAVWKGETVDLELERSLRPGSWEEFIGQERVKERLKVLVASARARGEPMEHLLFCGPAGVGKTSLATLLAKEMGVNFRATSGPILERAGDLAGLLTSLEPGEILFIDEIHRLPRAVEEYLYPAMEDFRIDIVIDQGPSARSVRLTLPKFTLVGATTRVGMLTAPLRSRFGMVHRLDYYPVEEMARIVQRAAGILQVPLLADGAWEVARRARGTPRIANHLVRWIRDFALVKGQGRPVDVELACEALSMLEIDEDGLDDMDKRLLETLVFKFRGGPVGIHSLAVALGEDPGTLEEVHEPYLILQGFLKRTPQGRVATPRTYEKLRVTPGQSLQGELWKEREKEDT